jgi:ribosomal protein S18 acetylase RimI-like enzyme
MESAPHIPVIRLANVEDADSIGLIHRVGRRIAVAEALPASALETTAAQHSEEWRHWLRQQAMGRANGFVLLSDSRQGVAGFVCAVPSRNPSGEGPWTVQHLYVLPAFQGQGEGRRLEQAAIARMRAAGAEAAELVTFADNPHRRFHESLGWRAVGEEVISLRGLQAAGIRYRRTFGRTQDQPQDQPQDQIGAPPTASPVPDAVAPPSAEPGAA